MTPVEEACAGIIAAVAERHADGITLRRCPSPVVLCTDEGRMARFSSMAMQGRALRSADVEELMLLNLAVPFVAEHVSQYGTLADLSNRSRVVA